ncbi:MAG: putative Pre-mRNA-processing ATP-dependent RNA helicase PRP5 [Streblomastix strix]|uniref:RNA helicase n=1 Tax=Streblomastix strix TaxID=222440 RepID=A0A5J4VIL8_9EUKA|nr:MAG: putative Pre-mRNA-processing ATP-dependent RNA helicase PRP5 [Streblomastix strix]
MPFEKTFYIESQEISALSQAEVQRRRQELEGIRVKGKNCPCPVTKWEQMGFDMRVQLVLTQLDFITPTPIQAQVLPAIMSGRDVIGIAKTGSGKTMGFVLPLIRHVLAQEQCMNNKGPIGLIFAPTRELCRQIYIDIKMITKKFIFNNRERIRTICVYGGTDNVSNQISVLKNGCEIVVCTPGRLIEILSMHKGQMVQLERTTYVVLDEADRMMDMGFMPQIMLILKNIRPDRQTVLFSATFPKALEAIVRQILNNPLEIIVGKRSAVCSDVLQIIRIIERKEEEEDKLDVFLDILDEWQDVTRKIVERRRKQDELLFEMKKKKRKRAELDKDDEEPERITSAIINDEIEQNQQGEEVEDLDDDYQDNVFVAKLVQQTKQLKKLVSECICR